LIVVGKKGAGAPLSLFAQEETDLLKKSTNPGVENTGKKSRGGIFAVQHEIPFARGEKKWERNRRKC